MIIAGQIPDGSTVDVAVDGDRLTFIPTVPAKPATDDNVEVVEGEIVDSD